MGAPAGLENLVSNALLRAGFSGDAKPLVVAVSGGPDSSALVHCLHRLTDRHRLRLHLAHLNHNFRGEEAYADARFVSDLAERLGLDATVEERNVLKFQQERRISSFEHAARELRYGFLAEVAESTGADAVATGHTADDVAETVLLHILRGSGIHGLRGMSELSPWPWPWHGGRLNLFRPLLGATKAETIGYCQAVDAGFRDDSGNYLSRFTRNRVRHGLLPHLASEYNPKVRQSLVRLARAAALELDFMEGEVARLWPQVAMERDGAVQFRQSTLGNLHPALRVLLLRKAYAQVTGNTLRLEERHLHAMDNLAEGTGGDRVLDLPGGLKFHRSFEGLRLSRGDERPCPFPELEGDYPIALPSSGGAEVAASAGPWRVTLQAVGHLEAPGGGPPSLRNDALEDSPGDGAWTAYFNRRALMGRLLVRARRQGDRFQPLGMDGTKKLRHFLTDQKVPREWRNRVPLLEAQRGIAWVVGYRIAHWARVDPEEPGAGEIVRATFEKQE